MFAIIFELLIADNVEFNLHGHAWFDMSRVFGQFVLLVLLTLKEGRNVLFNDALNTFYLRLYGVRHNYGKGPLR